MTWETTSFPSLSAFNHCVGIYHFTYQRTVQLPLDTDVNGDNNNSNSNNNLYRLWHAFLLSQDLCPFRFLENNVMKWSKSERDKQISYNIPYMWNLEKWNRWTYLQSRNRVTNVEKKLTVTKSGEGGWDELGDRDRHIDTTTHKIDN